MDSDDVKPMVVVPSAGSLIMKVIRTGRRSIDSYLVSLIDEIRKQPARER